MSQVDFYDPEITLIDKNTVSVTPITIDGDSSMGNLTPYRLSASYNDTINEKTKSGQITLRAPNGLFDSIAPILTDENVKNKYLIQVQLRQQDDVGQKFRFEISSTVHDIGSAGDHITLQLTAYDIRIEEFLDSERIVLQTPRQSFDRRIRNFLFGRDLTSTGSIKLTYANNMNALPDDERQKQDWLPTEPKTTKELLNEIIFRTSTPQNVTGTNEDWFYNIVPENDTESFRIFVDRFGINDSGVILDVTENGTATILNEINANFDNTKFKNVVILKGKKGSHTVPMDFTRFASDITHARIASSWDINIQFLKGDYTKIGDKYYKCKRDHTSSASNTPGLDFQQIWEDLLAATRSSPWTTNENLWLANMSNSISPPSGFVGFFNDINIVRKRYDLDNAFSEFEAVSVKDVEGFLTEPSNIPSDQLSHGKRWLINGNTQNTPWTGHTNQIAQWDESVSPGVWRFSKSPVTNDIVNLQSAAQILRFNGVNWETIWSLNTNPQTPSPFFPVESLSKVPNRHGIDKAVEFRFNWNTFDVENITGDILRLVGLASIAGATATLLGHPISDLITNTISNFLQLLGLNNNAQLISTFGIGNVKNKASRRYGFNIKLPFPSRTVNNAETGSQIKKSTIDFNNLSESLITGERGWNNGKRSEDLSNIRGVRYWVKLTHQNKAELPINGIANVPMIFWFRDLFDRVVFYRYTIRAHDSWIKIEIPAGPDSNLEIFDSRIDELWTVLGYTFPFNHFIKDRELTGATFDWRFVKEMGCFNADSYDDNFLYVAGQNNYLDVITEHALQYIVKNPLAFYTGGAIAMENVITDHVLFAIDDIHFMKDAYVTSEDNPQPAPRMKKINASSQYDYVTMEGIVKRQKSRLQFHPEHHTIYCRGNVNLKPGKRFTLQSTNFSKILVAQSVQHIEDSTGYHCKIEGIRKYEV